MLCLQLLLLMWPGEAVGFQPWGPRTPDDAGPHLEDLDWPQSDMVLHSRAEVKVRLGLARGPLLSCLLYLCNSWAGATLCLPAGRDGFLAAHSYDLLPLTWGTIPGVLLGAENKLLPRPSISRGAAV